MSYKPRFRRSVRVEQATLSEGGTAFRVFDPPAGVKVHVDSSLAPLLELVDGEHEVEAILASGRAPRENGKRLLLSLAFTGVLEGIDDGERQSLVEARATGPAIALDLPFQLVLGSKFSCGSCGECCRSYSPGPLSPDEMHRLASAPFVRDDPEYRGRSLFVLRATEDESGGIGPPTYHLARRDDGSCVFLMPDGRCRVHKELGADAKPDVCKLFPWVVTPTPRGIVVSDRTECSTFSRSSAEGPPLEQRFAEVRALFRRKALGSTGLFSPAIVLPGPIAISHARYRSAVERLIELLHQDRPESAFARLEACRDGIMRLARLVTAAEIEPGATDRAQAAFEAIPLDELLAPGSPAQAGLAPDPALFEAAFLRVVERLLPIAERFVREWDERTGGGPFPIEAVMPLPMAEIFRAGLEHLAGRRTPSATIDLEAPVVRGALVRAVLQRIHGNELECDVRATASVARSVLTLLASVACARAHAGARGAATVEPDDLDRGQVAAVRGLSAPTARRAFHEDANDLDLIFANLTGLAARAAR